MIESISLSKTATYGDQPEVLGPLRRVNFIFGTNGKRYITPHTRVLMHQPSGGAGGSATDIRINADLILHMKKELAEIIADRTGKTVEQIDRDFDRDKWFTAQEALEYGFVDHIVDQPQSIGRKSSQEGA